MTNITIDGKQYDSERLSEDAKAQVTMIQFVDGELAKLQAQNAVLQTARAAYGKRLSELLGEASKPN